MWSPLTASENWCNGWKWRQHSWSIQSYLILSNLTWRGAMTRVCPLALGRITAGMDDVAWLWPAGGYRRGRPRPRFTAITQHACTNQFRTYQIFSITLTTLTQHLSYGENKLPWFQNVLIYGTFKFSTDQMFSIALITLTQNSSHGNNKFPWFPTVFIYMYQLVHYRSDAQYYINNSELRIF